VDFRIVLINFQFVMILFNDVFLIATAEAAAAHIAIIA
jgi:hypothetical protein